jgi:hypothetical protein
LGGTPVSALAAKWIVGLMGLFDDLSGVHGIPLDSASAICPNGGATNRCPLF